MALFIFAGCGSKTEARALQYRRDTPPFSQENKARVRPTDPKKTVDLANTTDPICGMKVDPNTPNIYIYQGRNYGFCTPDCRAKFAANPAQYFLDSIGDRD